MSETHLNAIPSHVAIIMDGNGRWAQERNRPRIFGHQEGAKRVREVIEAAGRTGVKELTLFAFSEENWGRPDQEIGALFQLLTGYLEREMKRLRKENVRLRAIGSIQRLPLDCQRLLAQAEEETKQSNGLTLTLALSYGGRSEIVQSCRKIAQKIADGNMKVDDINSDLFSQHLDTVGLLDPDLLIRTSGEQRISNFLLWQIAYAELVFSPIYWPDFGREQFDQAIKIYQTRKRRFGKVINNPSEIDLCPVTN